VAGKLFQGAITHSEKKELTYTNKTIMRIKFVGMTSSVNIELNWIELNLFAHKKCNNTIKIRNSSKFTASDIADLKKPITKTLTPSGKAKNQLI